MSHDHIEHEDQRDRPRALRFWRSKAGVAAVGFLLVGLFFLLSEHRAHLFGVLPFLLILACPLMHLFMHRGHGGHHRQDQPRKPDTGAEP
jgi:hypothetical protein